MACPTGESKAGLAVKVTINLITRLAPGLNLGLTIGLAAGMALGLIACQPVGQVATIPTLANPARGSSAAAPTRSAQAASDFTSLSYDSPTLRLTIDGGRLRWTRIEYQFDASASAVPSASREIDGTRRLLSEEVAGLARLVNSPETLSLPEISGAPPGERFYAYRLMIRRPESASGQTQTQISLFRGNPAWPATPAAFSRLERYLRVLVGDG